MPKTNLTIMDYLVDPEVMADMISGELPHALRFINLAPIDYTLVGQPGTTITIPRYGYIGDAEVVAEGEAIPYGELSTSSETYTIHKIGRGVKLSDEAVLSGYGRPVDEAGKQIAMAIANKIDNDVIDEIKTTKLTVQSSLFGPELVDAIEIAFDDETGETGVIFMSTKDAIKHRKAMAQDWTRDSELGDSILVTGAYGRALGWEVIRTNKLEDGKPLAVKAGALKTYLKRETQAESYRDIDHKITKYNADRHYVTALVDESKAIKVEIVEVPVEEEGAGYKVINDGEEVNPHAKNTKAHWQFELDKLGVEWTDALTLDELKALVADNTPEETQED